MGRKMKRAKKLKAPIFCGQPEFVRFIHSRWTVDDFLKPVDSHAKLIDGEFMLMDGIRFVETDNPE